MKNEMHSEVAEGLKFDSEKPRFDLLDPVWLEGVAKVLTFGAAKYDAHNWRKGIAYSRCLAALMRHTAAIQRGEDRDPETGYLHTYHISCCAMFLSSFMEDGRSALDDRPLKQAAGNLPEGSTNVSTRATIVTDPICDSHNGTRTGYSPAKWPHFPSDPNN